MKITIRALSVAFGILAFSNMAVAKVSNTILSCDFKNGNTVEIVKDGNNLIYGYGPTGKAMEKVIPEKVNDNLNVVNSYQSTAHIGDMTAYYRFINGVYSYVIYHKEGDDINTDEGLAVFKGKKLLQRIHCVGEFKTTTEFDWVDSSTVGIKDDPEYDFNI